MKTVAVARLLVTRAATAVAGMGLHVDMTAYVFSLLINLSLPCMPDISGGGNK